MKQEEAMEIVSKTRLGLQRVRSMTVEELTRMGWEEKTVKAVIKDLVPWMTGEKGDAFLSSLSMVENRGKVTGQELYNFMAILHLLDPNLLNMIQGTVSKMLPKPEISWLVDLGI